MSWLGIALGFVALIVPGIYLMLRWAVVAQAAAVEREGWLPALRSGGRLVDGHCGHVFVLIVMVVVVVSLPSYLIELAVIDNAPAVVSSLVGLVVLTLTLSFSALTTALLYFDLRTRHEAVPAPAERRRPSTPLTRIPRRRAR